MIAITEQPIIKKKLTNAEGRSKILYIKTPTNPVEVTPETPLEKLNLNWTEKELPERIRTKHVHRLHPYLGKFIPQIVEVFLRKYFKTGQTILDPFSGSGTTLVQANELGLKSIGFDISEFNVLLAKVKTDDYNIKLLTGEIKDILRRVESFVESKGGQKNIFEENYYLENTTTTNDPFLLKWFAPQTLSELLLFRHLSNEYHHKDLLKIILCRSARSARLTTHFDLDFPKNPVTGPYECYKHRRVCQPTTSAYKFLYRYALDSLKRIEEYKSIKTNSKVIVRHEDSRFADFDKIDGIITSPPYVGLIDYHEQHRYAYKLLGLNDNSEKEIGAAMNGSSIKAKDAYVKAMAEVFINTSSRVKRNGRIIVIAGDRNNLYPTIAKLSGLKLESQVERHVNRRTGRRSTEFYESIFIFKK